MRVFWTPEAEADRASIWDFIAADDPRAAARLDSAFAEATRSMRRFPMIGRVGAVAGTREVLPHPSYRLTDEIVDQTIWVLALVHTARRWPPLDG